MKVCKTAKFYKFEGWEKTPSKFFYVFGNFLFLGKRTVKIFKVLKWGGVGHKQRVAFALLTQQPRVPFSAFLRFIVEYYLVSRQ